MKVHFIAIGGSIMHALACDMKTQGHEITGSDDEIYEPSKTQLSKYEILPPQMGWDENRITPEIDVVVLGMHAKADNPELVRAQELGLEIQSFPAFVAGMSKQKTRVVIAGSHGKTTTTSMIMHALRIYNIDFDFLVGARLTGFDNMVQLSDAPIIIIEGDEYLSSAIDRRPKIVHYQPDMTVITGIEWDHMNVFPTEENYIEQFEKYVGSLKNNVALYFDGKDSRLTETIYKFGAHTKNKAYQGFNIVDQSKDSTIRFQNVDYRLKVFGRHNMANMNAAMLVCEDLGLSNPDFLKAMESFEGASKRQQFLFDNKDQTIILDFAHAPSKVRATVKAVRKKYPYRKMISCFELHTYSSLNGDYLPLYNDCFVGSDKSFVFYDHHTLEIKRLPDLKESLVQESFGGETLVFTQSTPFKKALKKEVTESVVILLMTSGNFMTDSLIQWAEDLLN